MSDNLLIRDVAPSDAEAIASIYNPYILNTVITFEEIPVSAEEINYANQCHPQTRISLSRDGTKRASDRICICRNLAHQGSLQTYG